MTDIDNRRDDLSGPYSGTPPEYGGLFRLLIASLEALASAGQGGAACRLAGQACAGLRHTDPQGWNNLSALLHRLSRRTPPVGNEISEDAK